MTWTLVLLLGAGAYACKVLGPRRHRVAPPAARRRALPGAGPGGADLGPDRQGHVLDGTGARARRPGRRRRRGRHRGVAPGPADRRDRARRDRHGRRSTSVLSRSRLPRQIRRITGLPADALAERAAEPPRERQVLLPREPRAPAVVERLQREPPGAGDEPVVAHAHRPLRLPLRDLHAVGQPDRPDPGDALEPRADARVCSVVEADRLGVGHPVDVATRSARAPARPRPGGAR